MSTSRKRISVLVCLWSLVVVGAAAAQSGNGSLRGTIKDEQGGVLPGTTVTAKSPDALTPGVSVTDNDGAYRITSLPPGTYTVSAELTGFTVIHREGVVVRAGSNFQLDDIIMKVGSLEETITVTSESPMIEVSSPTTTLNMDAEFQKALPLVESKYWTDFLQMTPGVLSRPHNDGSGRQNYFALGVEHREHVTQMEGLMAGNYNDMNVNRTGLSTDAIADTQVKTGGVDASSPMGYGLVINMVSRSGGNHFSGAASYTYQPFGWNGNNAQHEEGYTGTSATRKVNQADMSLGGPIRQNHTWFFVALRISKNATTPDRTPANIAAFQAFAPELKELPSSILESYTPWVKISTKLGANHDLVAIYQGDRLKNSTASSASTIRSGHTDTGGSMVGFNLKSVWGSTLTTTFAGDYNNKGGNGRDSYDEALNNAGPSWNIHRTADANTGGTLTGSGSLLSGGGQGQMDLDTASYSMFRGDLTWFKQGWGGSHEWMTGFLLEPWNKYDEQTVYLNNGFTSESRRQIDPNDPSKGVTAFQRSYQTGGLEQQSGGGRDHDYGVYVQDTWKAGQRLTLAVGIRADFLRRFDPYRNLQLQKSREIGPRAGGTFLLTADAKNVVRSSWSRVHRQLMGGRDPIAEFGGSDANSSRTEYDLDGNGSFETAIISPARSAGVSSQQFDPAFRQPYIDEFILGYTRQLPLNISVDVAATTKTYHRQYSQVEINGFWPDAPNKPFGGFGRVDPNAGQLFRVTNNTWADTKYRAAQVAFTKNMSRGFQVITSFHHQWQHLQPTGADISPLGWNPTDPARFIQPDAFDNVRNIWRAQGLVDQNSLSTGNALINNPIWAPFSFRLAGTWQAPKGVVVSANWTAVAGNYTGPIIDQLAANDPRLAVFGPATVTSSTGARQTNPLATRTRLCGASIAGKCTDAALVTNRTEGQVQQNTVHTVGLKLAKNFKLGGAREIQLGFNTFNLMNFDRYTEWNRSGANRIYSPSVYLTGENQQPPRSYQVDASFKF